MTIGRKLSSLRAFFRLAVRRRLVSQQPGRRAARAQAGQAPAGVPGQGRRRPPARRQAARAPTPSPISSRSSARCSRSSTAPGCACRRPAVWTSTTSRSTAARGYVTRAPGQGTQGSPRAAGSKARAALDAWTAQRTARLAAAAGRARTRPAAGAALFVSAARAAPRPARRPAAARSPRAGDAGRRGCRRTPCATASRPTCWARAPTCARSRRCSVTPACAPRSGTRTSTSIT